MDTYEIITAPEIHKFKKMADFDSHSHVIVDCGVAQAYFVNSQWANAIRALDAHKVYVISTLTKVGGDIRDEHMVFSECLVAEGAFRTEIELTMCGFNASLGEVIEHTENEYEWRSFDGSEVVMITLEEQRI